MATPRSMRRLRVRWSRRGYITSQRHHLSSAFAALAFSNFDSQPAASEPAETYINGMDEDEHEDEDDLTGTYLSMGLVLLVAIGGLGIAFLLSY